MTEKTDIERANEATVEDLPEIGEALRTPSNPEGWRIVRMFQTLEGVYWASAKETLRQRKGAVS